MQMCLQSPYQDQYSSSVWSRLIFHLRIKKYDAKAFPRFEVEVENCGYLF